MRRHFAVLCWKFTMLALFSYVICWHQHHVLLPASFFFVYLASFMYQTQNFFCKTRACRLPPCLHLESCSLTDPTKVPKCVSKQRFGTFRLKHFATRRLMLFLVLFQEASSSVYRGNKQHGSVPRSSLQNTARVTKHGLLAL